MLCEWLTFLYRYFWEFWIFNMLTFKDQIWPRLSLYRALFNLIIYIFLVTMSTPSAWWCGWLYICIFFLLCVKDGNPTIILLKMSFTSTMVVVHRKAADSTPSMLTLPIKCSFCYYTFAKRNPLRPVSNIGNFK